MATLKGTVAFLHIIVNTLLWCIPIYLLAIPRALASTTKLGASLSALMGRAADGWVACNRFMLRTLRLARIDAHWQLTEALDRSRWYVVVSNHQSWSDILILQDVSGAHTAAQQEPAHLGPLLGVAMWLDFYVALQPGSARCEPSLRLKDQATPRRLANTSCAARRAVANFSGTRFYRV
jgi:1-acyl-sn-glycerol-3-phosphate acyltransferase